MLSIAVIMTLEIPGFQIQEKISEDTSSEVWQGYQLSLQRVVEIRVLRPEVAKDIDEVNRFIVDARSAARIKHPNVTQVFDVNDHEGIYYAVQEHIDGKRLCDIIENSKRMPWKKAVAIMQFVAEALNHAMETAAITHRYLTPYCILLDTEEIVKVSDLGMAKPIDGVRLLEQVRAEEVTEEANYVSPEQVRGSSIVSCQADMYSMGAILYHMITGQKPFKSRSRVRTAEQQVVGFLRNPKDMVPTLPPAVVNLITRLMMKNPGKRFLTWNDLEKELHNVIGGRFQKEKKFGFASTIAPSASFCSAAPAVTPKPAPEKPVPVMAHLAMLALAAGVWGLAASRLLPARPTRTLPPPAQQTPAHIQETPQNTPPPQNAAETHDAGEPSPQQQADQPEEPQQTQDSTPETTQAPSGPVIPNSFFVLRLNTAKQMLNEQYADAAFSLAEEIDKKPPPHVLNAMTSLQKYVVALSKINEVIAKRFEDKLQTRVTIRNRNYSRDVKVVGVQDDKVIVEVDQKRGDGSVTLRSSFSVGSLDAAERLHWLGSVSTPEECGMKFILYWKTGRYDEAKLIAPQCGALANEFYQLAEAKLQEVDNEQGP